MSDAPTEDALARSINAGLLPQAFPFRREVEFAATRHGSIGRVSFYDSWWRDGDTVCFCVASLPSGGVSGALEAASLKHLLRAALEESPVPRMALASCRRHVGVETAAAVAVLDLESGLVRTASLGSGGVIGGDGGDRTILGSGADLWIVAGPMARETAARERMPGVRAGLSAAEIVEAAGAGLLPGAAFGLIRYKGPGRRSSGSATETISITNENGRIAEAIERMEKFRALNGIDERAFAGFDLALDEILTNLVSYAFRDGARHRIDVKLDFSGKRFSIEVRDDGIAFNPLDIPPPNLEGELGERDVGGLGMHFVRNIADEITYRREANWNILRLSKKIGGS